MAKPKTSPLLLGLTNPHSDRPIDALCATPIRSAGWRLWRLIKDVAPTISSVDYERSFRRRNILDHPFELRLHAPVGTTVVVLGDEVRAELNHRLSRKIEKVLIHPQLVDGVIWRLIPHTSGRTLLYNDPTVRALVGLLLLDLYQGRY